MIVKASVWWCAVVPGAAAAIVLYSLAFPAGAMGPFVLGGIAWLLVGVVWLVRLVLRRDRWLLATPLVAALTAGLAWAEVPLDVAFTTAKGGLAEQVAEGKAGRAGIYRIEAVRPEGGVTYLPLRGGGDAFAAESGFAHAPDGIPQGTPEYLYFRHLDGPWYWYDASE
ncbi:hypothetical protein LO762_21975 [Actinocorallia sp. API 0066]|uniref:hypothetical protein n=1 Tax=Actinocorallia sp. API 0066 TaxID=2896846 RepID=UPI001E3956AC|nr:hypothetical protein [Actinocorallia sp. API 0066]MCD0451843.1 hypothetical protein [Actinocorallia sp. API 0066]